MSKTTLVLPHIVTGFIANHTTSVTNKSRPFHNTANRPPVRDTAHSCVKLHYRNELRNCFLHSLITNSSVIDFGKHNFHNFSLNELYEDMHQERRATSRNAILFLETYGPSSCTAEHRRTGLFDLTILSQNNKKQTNKKKSHITETNP